MPAKNSVRSSFGTEGSGPQFSNPWTEIASPLIYLDAQFQDQTSTSVPDRSGNGRNFQINTGSNAATVHKTDSKGNKYFDLGASALVPSSGADYFPYATAASYPTVTYVLWTRVKPNATSVSGGAGNDWRTLTRTITNGGHHVIVQDDGGSGAKIGFWDGSFQTDNYHIADAGASTNGLQTYSGSGAGAGTGNWHFMVVKFQTTNPQMRIFINGEQTNPYATATSTTAASTNPLYNSTGGWPGHISGCCSATNPTSQWWGDIAAFAAYNGHVSAAALTQLYNKTKHFFQPAAGVATTRLQNFTSGVAFSQYITTDYEFPATNFTVVSGALVTGLSLNSSTGLVSGTPNGSTSTATVRITFSNGYTVDQPITHASSGLFTFTTATFTTGGANGQSGPNLAQAISGLGSPSWASNTSYFDMPINGYQRWTVPMTGNYTITAVGAGYNGSGGACYGASVTQTFALTQSEKLIIVCGQQPGHYAAACGGSGVARGSDYTTATALLVAGGAGSQNRPAGITTNWYSSTNGGGQQNTSAGYGGPSGTPNGSWSCGGGGFLTSGNACPGNGNGPGGGFRQGGGGGNSASGAAYGGFGFGGASGGHSSFEYSAGGGYTGAYAGTSSSYGGGGGGSYSSTGSFSASSTPNLSTGYVTITKV